MKLSRHSRLPAEDQKELRQMREAKPWLWSYEALAQHFGTTRWTAMNICKSGAAYRSLAQEAA